MVFSPLQPRPNATDTYAALGHAIGELEWARAGAIAFSGQLARVQQGVSRCVTELGIIAREDEEMLLAVRSYIRPCFGGREVECFVY